MMNSSKNQQKKNNETMAELPASPPSPSKWAQWEAFFFNEGANLAFLALLMSLNVSMFVWGVWEFTKPHWTTDSSVLRITLPIARGAGRLVTWNSALLLVTGCKYAWTLVRQSPVHLGFPVDNIMPHYHRVVALIIIFMGCVVHSIPQIVNYATQELAIEGGSVWTFGDGLATKQLLITGILLFFLFLAFFLTTLECIRRTAWGFRLFSSVHICGIICAIPLLLIHGTIRGCPITLYFTILPVCMYLVDSLVLRRYLFSTRQAEVIHLTCTPAGGDTSNGDDDEHVVKLVIRNPDFRFTPGQYAEIKIPQLARYEWHPFTIANAPNLEGKVVFYIKAAGRWTSALYELVSEASVKGGDLPIAYVGVRGPYGAPAQDNLSYRHIIVIGSGIGVTPLLSVWKHLVSALHFLASKPKRTAQPSKVMVKNDCKRLEEDNDEQRLLDSLDVNSVDVVRLERPLVSFRARAAYYASCLESMTLNICLFIFSLTAETTVLCVWLFEYNRESALLQIIVSVIALIVFSSKMVLSLITYHGRYLHSFVFALESCIVVTDAVALISSATSYHSPSRKGAIFYFAFFAAFVVLHAIRVFHIFYATARPPVQHTGEKNRQGFDRIDSITGIWISRHYSSMSFAISDLVEGIQDLSPIFSLQLYATRDKSSTVEQVSPFRDSRCGPSHALHAGRPVWEAILTKAIECAHESSITTSNIAMTNSSNSGAAIAEGESVGVFFCGSPAIARELQRVAQQVMANHQYATRMHSGTPCQCRLLVHKENF